MRSFVIYGASVASILSLTLLLGGCSPTQAASQTSPPTAPAPAPAAPPPPVYSSYSGTDKIVVFDSTAKTVTVNLVASEGDASKGMNFNGFANGDMKIQVPTGWRVKVRLTVGGGSLSHSALIVPWSAKDKPGNWPLAFPRAAVADYASGIEAGDAPQTFSFKADQPGQYGLICGVPGHVAMGMWDEFDVMDTLSNPQVIVKS